MMARMRDRAKWAEGETYALFLAYKDPRVPLYAKLFAMAVVAYAFSPIDLIPDFIPILGYLDDLVLVPLGAAIAVSMIPDSVLEECRAEAQSILGQGKPIVKLAAAIIIVSWIVITALLTVAIWLNIRWYTVIYDNAVSSVELFVCAVPLWIPMPAFRVALIRKTGLLAG